LEYSSREHVSACSVDHGESGNTRERTCSEGSRHSTDTPPADIALPFLCLRVVAADTWRPGESCRQPIRGCIIESTQAHHPRSQSIPQGTLWLPQTAAGRAHIQTSCKFPSPRQPTQPVQGTALRRSVLQVGLHCGMDPVEQYLPRARGHTIRYWQREMLAQIHKSRARPTFYRHQRRLKSVSKGVSVWAGESL
jgi:hypothetical protein